MRPDTVSLRDVRAEHPMTRFEQARAAQQDAVARFLAGGNAADRLRLQMADAELAKAERAVEAECRDAA